MCSHSQKPSRPMVNGVRGFTSSSNPICQYPDFRSNVEIHTAPCKQSNVSSIWGNEHPSFIVLLFNFHRLIQNLSPPSFFLTNTTALAHGTETPPNCSDLSYLLEVILHLLIQVMWYPSIPFLERLGVSNCDSMFQNITFAQIQNILGEDMSRFNQKIFG